VLTVVVGKQRLAKADLLSDGTILLARAPPPMDRSAWVRVRDRVRVRVRVRDPNPKVRVRDPKPNPNTCAVG
jgi:hypothetical protein